MGSIYNEAIWESTTHRPQGCQQRRTLQRDADHHRRYSPHGHNLQHAGRVAKPFLRMAREQFFTFIVHFIMAVGQLVVHFLEALCSKLDEVLRACVPFVLDGARTGIRLGFAGFPNLEKLYALLEPWEHVEDGACLDGTHCAGGLVAEMRELVQHLHRTYHHCLPPHCRGPASCFQEHITQKSGKDSVNVLVSLQPHRMAMMSQDIVESMNRIPKVGYNDHSDCGGGCAEHTTLRESCVVAQLWSAGSCSSICHPNPGVSHIRRPTW